MRKLFTILSLTALFLSGCEKDEVDTSTQGLILYLPFNNSLNDASRELNNATMVSGTPSYLQNRYFDQLSALRMNEGQYLEVQDKKFSTLKSFTFYIEFYPTSDDYQVLFGKRGYVVTPGVKYNSGFNIAINDLGQARAQFRRAGECQTETLSGFHPEVTSGNERVLVDCWNYVACTFDGQVQKLYLNGKLVGQQTLNGELVICDSDPLRIGTWWSGDPKFFDGILDEVRVYDRALPDKEIFDLYKRSKK